MSSYRRAKKENSIQPSSKEMTIKIGSVKDSFMSLKTMCNDKSVELQKTIQLNNEDKLNVVFWTADIPELIGISTFTKNKDGLISFNLNCDESTLQQNTFPKLRWVFVIPYVFRHDYEHSFLEVLFLSSANQLLARIFIFPLTPPNIPETKSYEKANLRIHQRIRRF